MARILDGMLPAAFALVVSEALLAEYRTMPVRRGPRQLHGLTVTEVETQLVTGNKLLRRHAATRGRVLSPSEFVGST